MLLATSNCLICKQMPCSAPLVQGHIPSWDKCGIVIMHTLSCLYIVLSLDFGTDWLGCGVSVLGNSSFIPFVLPVFPVPPLRDSVGRVALWSTGPTWKQFNRGSSHLLTLQTGQKFDERKEMIWSKKDSSTKGTRQVGPSWVGWGYSNPGL